MVLKVIICAISVTVAMSSISEEAKKILEPFVSSETPIALKADDGKYLCYKNLDNTWGRLITLEEKKGKFCQFTIDQIMWEYGDFLLKTTLIWPGSAWNLGLSYNTNKEQYTNKV